MPSLPVAELLNRFTRGMMLVAGQTMPAVECTPAAYITAAANEAEKAALPPTSTHVASVESMAGSGWPATRPTS